MKGRRLIKGLVGIVMLVLLLFSMSACQYQGGQVDLPQIETGSVSKTQEAVEEIPEAETEFAATPYETIDPADLYRYEAARNGGIIITQYIGSQAEVVIPREIEGLPVVEIRENAFYTNQSVQSVIIPESVSEIGEQAFAGCSNLTDIMIPATVTSMGKSCLAGTPWFEEQTDEFVVVGDGICIKYTGEPRYDEWIDGKWVDTYEGSSMLIVIPEGVRMVTDIVGHVGGNRYYYGWGYRKFRGWDGIVLPDSLEVIGKGAFDQCRFLSEIIFPKGLKKIEEYAFYKTDLSEIIIPESVKMVGEYAFGRCRKLSDVTVLSENTWVDEDAFDMTPYLDSLKYKEIRTGGNPQAGADN